MATIYEVSQIAGVSLATVSRVINNSDKVSLKTRKKVERAMEELGYRPNAIAQSLASNRTNSVGILVPEVYGPFFGVMLAQIERELRLAGKHVIITAGHSEEQTERDSFEFLASRRVDALILHVYALSDDFLQELRSHSMPIFVVGRSLSGMRKRCFSIDDEKGGYLATRYLLEKGHRKIACIAGPLWKSDAKARYLGYERALREFGIEPDPQRVAEGDYEEGSGRQGIRKLLESGRDFSAIVCGNDEMAAGAVDEAHQEDINIPTEISVVGFDNVSFTRYMSPRLTTVNYPIDRMGCMAARAVLRDVYGRDDLEVQNRFELELIERDSVRDWP